MSYHILYETTPWHARAALFDDRGRLVTLRLDDEGRHHIEGAVFLGRVRSVEKGLGAAFVDIGDKRDGLLPFNTLPKGQKLTEGEALLVRVTRGGFDGKGAKLSARVALKMPDDDGAIPRLITAAPSCLRRALHDAASNPVTVWIADARLHDTVRGHVHDEAIRIIDGEADWMERLDTELDRILADRPVWPIPHGNLIVELTSAVATIDINATPPANMGKQDGATAVNLAAASEVARICRLLDLGGTVIVDFISPKTPQGRQLVGEHLEAAFQTADDKFTDLRPMSRHGIVEINRERTGPSLNLLLKRPRFVAGAIALRLWRPLAGKNRVLQRTVHCHPEVAMLLQQRLTTEYCLTHVGHMVSIQADASLPVGAYHVEG